MAFKLVVFIAILIGVAVVGMRGYQAAVERYERERQDPEKAVTATAAEED